MVIDRWLRVAGLTVLAIGLTGIGIASAAEQYFAELTPLNTAASGHMAGNTATFAVDSGLLTMTVAVNGLAPNVMHMQHYHGFSDGDDAICPTIEADLNGDGFIDLIETEPMAGTTMVPLHADPESLVIASDSYPIASPDGAIRYQRTVSLDKLQQAVADKFSMSELGLDKLVIFIHGVAPAAPLPASVESLPGVPAHVTLPVYCGVIERLQ